jgi:hypothetical protein
MNRSLAINKTSHSNPERLNAICPYFTMFPLPVPMKRLRKFPKEDWVLDPFCGRGTTNYAARLLGIKSVGIDSNPVAVAIAEGKMVTTSAEEISNECISILKNSPNVASPEGEFWSLCYHHRTLSELSSLRAKLLKNADSPQQKALRALIMGLLHGPRNKGLPSYLSNQMPRTYASKPDYSVRYWKKHGMEPVYIDLAELVERKAAYYFASLQSDVPFRVLCGDSRTLNLNSLGVRFSSVITSPPYYGMRTYVPDQWLRYWFLGGPETVPYKNEHQLSHASPTDFSAQLAGVWENVARTCQSGAVFTIRFGGIHDRKAHPKRIILDSIYGADCKLRVLTTRSAGLSTSGKRQADQFKRKMKKPVEEFDFYVRLEEPYNG